jgi:hypothetical protein
MSETDDDHLAIMRFHFSHKKYLTSFTARAEEELHTTPKLTNQLFEDSHNASFVSVVS